MRPNRYHLRSCLQFHCFWDELVNLDNHLKVGLSVDMCIVSYACCVLCVVVSHLSGIIFSSYCRDTSGCNLPTYISLYLSITRAEVRKWPM